MFAVKKTKGSFHAFRIRLNNYPFMLGMYNYYAMLNNYLISYAILI